MNQNEHEQLEEARRALKNVMGLAFNARPKFGPQTPDWLESILGICDAALACTGGSVNLETDNEKDQIQGMFRMTRERLLANRILSIIGKNNLSYYTTPARVFLDTLEQVIMHHREEFGEPLGIDISKR